MADGQDERSHLAGADRAAAHLDVARRGAREALVRCIEPHQLLERRRDQARIASQLLLKRRVAGQVVDRACEQGGRRDMRGDQELAQAACDELVLERLAVDLHREEGADDVLRGIERGLAPRSHELPAFGVEMLVLALGGLDLEVRLSVLEALAARVQLAGIARAVGEGCRRRQAPHTAS